MWHGKNKSHLPGIIVFGSLFSSLLQVLLVTLVTAMIAYPNPYTRYFFFITENQQIAKLSESIVNDS